METVTSADGTSIAFDRSGSGPALILIGGALTDRRAADELVPLLDRRFTVVAYDRRGRGDSGDRPPYAVEREVEDLGALIDAVGGEAFVFGHSSGAVLALEAAIDDLPITRLAIYEPPFVVDDTRPPIPPDYVERVRALVAEDRRGDAVEYFLTQAVGVPQGAVTQMRGAPMWPRMESLAHTIAYDGAVMDGHLSGEPLPAAWVASVTIPTLVMDGGASPDWARNAVRQLAAILPNAERGTLAGQDHGAAPDLVVTALEGFFLDGD
jgi:pimeloyl-ACP methyl ester carboxylesterase